MATNTPNDEDEPPSNHPPFITPPPQIPRMRLPEVAQTQTPENEATIDDSANPNCDEDTYIHFHDADLTSSKVKNPSNVLAARLM